MFWDLAKETGMGKLRSLGVGGELVEGSLVDLVFPFQGDEK